MAEQVPEQRSGESVDPWAEAVAEQGIDESTVERPAETTPSGAENASSTGGGATSTAETPAATPEPTRGGPGRLVVFGAGTMGAGIAQVAAAGGWTVTVRDISRSQLDRGLSAIHASLAKFVAKQTISADDAAATLERIHTTTDADVAADADIVIEAVFERLDVKHEVFRQLDRVARPDAILATNTSAIPITKIAAVTDRPESVVGAHFFAPVPLMRLLEIVRGRHTGDDVIARTKAFGESVGKTCVVVERDVAGFVTTRLISALVMEAVRLYESGVASAEDIDTACKLGLGHAMGPLATADLTGVDILADATRNIWNETADPQFFPPELLSRMVDAGELGRKTGRGFYRYDEQSRST